MALSNIRFIICFLDAVLLEEHLLNLSPKQHHFLLHFQFLQNNTTDVLTSYCLTTSKDKVNNKIKKIKFITWKVLYQPFKMTLLLANTMSIHISFWTLYFPHIVINLACIYMYLSSFTTSSKSLSLYPLIEYINKKSEFSERHLCIYLVLL